MTAPITIVAEFGPTTGSGHIMRMLTLAHALRCIDRGISLLTGDLSAALVARATEAGVRIVERRSPIDSPDLIAEIESMESAMVIIDSYALPSSTINDLATRIPVVLIDDNGEHADATAAVLLNQNLHASTIEYGRGLDHSIRLLGPEYALVRGEVTALRGTLRDPGARRVLVALGGTDPLGLGPPIVDALGAIADIEIVHAHGLAGDAPFSPERMAEAIAVSTVGVVACGTTTWEAACLGLPFVGVVTADNQSIVGDSLIRIGLAEVIDARRPVAVGRIADEIIGAVTRLLDNATLRSTASARLEATVDGDGAARVAETLAAIVGD